MLTEARHLPRRGRFSNLFRWFRGVEAHRRSRHHLRNLDPHMRRDIGVTSADIEAELRRKVWDVPNWWR